MDLFDWAGLAATTTGAALLFLLFVDPQRAIQLVIIISTALSLVTRPGLWRAIAPALMLRLGLGSLAGLPLGLIAFCHADPVLVRALVGATILGFAVLLEWQRRGAEKHQGLFDLRADRDLLTGAVSGIATALIGMAGPPLVIYLLPAGVPPRAVRATLLSFFALAYAATLASHAVTVGIPTQTWLSAGILIPFAVADGLAGRPLGDRLGSETFATLAVLLLGAAGLYTLVAAAVFAFR